jgi:hypothetical protein
VKGVSVAARKEYPDELWCAAEALERDQLGCGLVDQPGEMTVEFGDLSGELLIAPSQAAQRTLATVTRDASEVLGRQVMATATSLSTARPRSWVSQLIGGGDHQGVELLGGLASRLLR